MEIISVGVICVGGIIVFNNMNVAYNLLNPKPKVFKVQEHLKHYDSVLDKEFDSQFNQLYTPDCQYILIEEEQNPNFIGNKVGKIIKKTSQRVSKQVSQQVNKSFKVTSRSK